jgi:hypothetical protein
MNVNVLAGLAIVSNDEICLLAREGVSSGTFPLSALPIQYNILHGLDELFVFIYWSHTAHIINEFVSACISFHFKI